MTENLSLESSQADRSALSALANDLIRTRPLEETRRVAGAGGVHLRSSVVDVNQVKIAVSVGGVDTVISQYALTNEPGPYGVIPCLNPSATGNVCPVS
jgi:hypothetical protein